MNINNIFKLLRAHIARSKDAYEVLGILAALAVSTAALWQSTAGLRYQADEFRLRNRPYVVLDNIDLSGPITTMDGYSYPYSILFKTINISDIPATAVHKHFRSLINGKQLSATTILPTSMPRDNSSHSRLGLQREVYELIMSSNVTLEVEGTVTYSGMLGEPPDHYKTIIKGVYSPQEQGFKIPTFDIK